MTQHLDMIVLKKEYEAARRERVALSAMNFGVSEATRMRIKHATALSSTEECRNAEPSVCAKLHAQPAVDDIHFDLGRAQQDVK